MIAASGSNHLFGQEVIVASMVMNLLVIFLLVKINMKQNSPWSGFTLFLSLLAISFEIGAAVRLW